MKAIVADAVTEAIIWQDHQRHETRQPEKELEFLRRMEEETGIGRRIRVSLSPAQAVARSPENRR